MRNVWLLAVVVMIGIGPVAMSAESEDLGHGLKDIFKGLEKTNHEYGNPKPETKTDACANVRPENGRVAQPPAPLASSDSGKPSPTNPIIRCTKATDPSGHPISCECKPSFAYEVKTGKCIPIAK